MADQGWRFRPRVMPRSVIDSTAFRIAEHAAAHAVSDIDVVFHGGEPLLAGQELIRDAVHAIRDALGRQRGVHFCLQTNGLLLTDEFLALFEELGVLVGLSMDGDASMHDRHRRHADGTGSHARAAAAASRLAGNRRLFGGFLCVIDLRHDPVRAYESLLAFSPPVIDFLLPHGNWSALPPGLAGANSAAPYGDWLIRVFDRWYHAPRKETSIRLFDDVLSLLLGGSSRTEEVGLSPVTTVVIESDGAIEQSDLLTAAYPGAGATGLNVVADSFDQVLLTPDMAARQSGLSGIAAACRACPVGSVCGGGLYAHRYEAGTGFGNPSVYCADLYRLISHIRGQVAADLNAGERERAWC